jgi:hypothetical protein
VIKTRTLRNIPNTSIQYTIRNFFDDVKKGLTAELLTKLFSSNGWRTEFVVAAIWTLVVLFYQKPGHQ